MKLLILKSYLRTHSSVLTKLFISILITTIIFDTPTLYAFQILTKGESSAINRDSIVIDIKKLKKKSPPVVLKQNSYASKWVKYDLGIEEFPNIYVEVNNKSFPPKDLSKISLTYSGSIKMQESNELDLNPFSVGHIHMFLTYEAKIEDAQADLPKSEVEFKTPPTSGYISPQSDSGSKSPTKPNEEPKQKPEKEAISPEKKNQATKMLIVTAPGENTIRLSSDGKNRVSDGEFRIFSKKNRPPEDVSYGWQSTKKDNFKLLIAPNSRILPSCLNGKSISAPDEKYDLVFTLKCLNPDNPKLIFDESEGLPFGTERWHLGSRNGTYWYNATLMDSKSCAEINKAKERETEAPPPFALPWSPSKEVTAPKKPTEPEIIKEPPFVTPDMLSPVIPPAKPEVSPEELEKQNLLALLPKNLRILTKSNLILKPEAGKKYRIGKGPAQSITIGGQPYKYRNLGENHFIYYQQNAFVPNDKVDVFYKIVFKGQETYKVASIEVEDMFLPVKYNVYEATDPSFSVEITDQKEGVEETNAPKENAPVGQKPNVTTPVMPPAPSNVNPTSETQDAKKEFDKYVESAKQAYWDANIEVSNATYLASDDVEGKKNLLKKVIEIAENLKGKHSSAEQAYVKAKEFASNESKVAEIEQNKQDYDTFVSGVNSDVENLENAVRRAEKEMNTKNNNKILLAAPGPNTIRLATYGDANGRNPVNDGELIVLSNKENSDAGTVSGWQRTRKDNINLYIAPGSKVSLSCKNGKSFDVPNNNFNLVFQLKCLNPNNPIYDNNSKGSIGATLNWGAGSSAHGKYYYDATLVDKKSCDVIDKEKKENDQIVEEVNVMIPNVKGRYQLLSEQVARDQKRGEADIAEVRRNLEIAKADTLNPGAVAELEKEFWGTYPEAGVSGGARYFFSYYRDENKNLVEEAEKHITSGEVDKLKQDKKKLTKHISDIDYYANEIKKNADEVARYKLRAQGFSDEAKKHAGDRQKKEEAAAKWENLKGVIEEVKQGADKALSEVENYHHQATPLAQQAELDYKMINHPSIDKTILDKSKKVIQKIREGFSDFTSPIIKGGWKIVVQGGLIYEAKDYVTDVNKALEDFKIINREKVSDQTLDKFIKKYESIKKDLDSLILDAKNVFETIKAHSAELAQYKATVGNLDKEKKEKKEKEEKEEKEEKDKTVEEAKAVVVEAMGTYKLLSKQFEIETNLKRGEEDIAEVRKNLKIAKADTPNPAAVAKLEEEFSYLYPEAGVSGIAHYYFNVYRDEIKNLLGEAEKHIMSGEVNELKEDARKLRRHISDIEYRADVIKKNADEIAKYKLIAQGAANEAKKHAANRNKEMQEKENAATAEKDKKRKEEEQKIASELKRIREEEAKKEAEKERVRKESEKVDAQLQSKVNLEKAKKEAEEALKNMRTSITTIPDEMIPKTLQIRSLIDLKYEVIIPARTMSLRKSKTIRNKTYYEVESKNNATLYIEENDALPSKKYEVTYDLKNPRRDSVTTVTKDPVYGNEVRTNIAYFVYDASLVRKTPSK